MSEAESPERLNPEREVTVDDVRQLMGASTPHFALQIRNRIQRLIADLPPGHPARTLGEREIVRLDKLAYGAEARGEGRGEGERAMPSLLEAELVEGEPAGEPIPESENV